MIAIKGMKLPSSCKVCPFQNCGLCYTANKVSDIKADIHNAGRPNACPLVDVTKLNWKYKLNQYETNWRNAFPSLCEDSLACQAGGAFVKTMVDEDLIRSCMEKDEDGNLIFSAQLMVVAE
jgi:hypothetical protein